MTKLSHHHFFVHIQRITASPPSSPIPSNNNKNKSSSINTPALHPSSITPAAKKYQVNVTQYEKYLKIEKLLQQKDGQELARLLQQIQ